MAGKTDNRGVLPQAPTDHSGGGGRGGLVPRGHRGGVRKVWVRNKISGPNHWTFSLTPTRCTDKGSHFQFARMSFSAVPRLRKKQTKQQQKRQDKQLVRHTIISSDGSLAQERGALFSFLAKLTVDGMFAETEEYPDEPGGHGPPAALSPAATSPEPVQRDASFLGPPNLRRGWRDLGDHLVPKAMIAYAKKVTSPRHTMLQTEDYHFPAGGCPSEWRYLMCIASHLVVLAAYLHTECPAFRRDIAPGPNLVAREVSDIVASIQMLVDNMLCSYGYCDLRHRRETVPRGAFGGRMSSRPIPFRVEGAEENQLAEFHAKLYASVRNWSCRGGAFPVSDPQHQGAFAAILSVKLVKIRCLAVDAFRVLEQLFGMVDPRGLAYRFCKRGFSLDDAKSMTASAFADPSLPADTRWQLRCLDIRRLSQVIDQLTIRSEHLCLMCETLDVYTRPKPSLSCGIDWDDFELIITSYLSHDPPLECVLTWLNSRQLLDQESTMHRIRPSICSRVTGPWILADEAHIAAIRGQLIVALLQRVGTSPPFNTSAYGVLMIAMRETSQYVLDFAGYREMTAFAPLGNSLDLYYDYCDRQTSVADEILVGQPYIPDGPS